MKNKSKTTTEHPFFCDKKNCRKTAWQTPEYLTKEDWETLEKVVRIIESGDSMEFYRFTTGNKNSMAFFYRAIGWPEGYVYCRNLNYCTQTAFVMMTSDSQGARKSDLVLMKEAIERNKH